MTLVRRSDTLALANLTDQALRVRAVEAASTYDTETLVQVTQAYMTTGSRKGARTSAKTLAAYALAVRDFVPWAQASGVQLLRPGRRDGGRYVAQLQTRPRGAAANPGRCRPPPSPSTSPGPRPLPRPALGRCHRRATVRGRPRPPDPTPGIVKNPPYMREVEDVLEHCDPRLAALLILCAHAGLRVTEALTVRAGDIQGAQLTVHGKGGKTRRVPLGRRVRAALHGLAPVTPEGHLFDWQYHHVQYRMRKVFAAAGHRSAWRGFHAARKHSGTRLYRATKDFTRVGLFLGHSSVDTTRRYVAMEDNDVQNEVEDF